MQYLNQREPNYDLTYSDVFLAPCFSEINSRHDVDVSCIDGSGSIPIVVANMTAVAGRRMAETIARRGGLAVLPQDIPLDLLREMILKIKKSHSVFDTPITLSNENTIAEALRLINKRSHGVIIITDDDNKPIGILSEKDLTDLDRFTKIGFAMTKKVYVLNDYMKLPAMNSELINNRLNLAPVVNKEGRLVGVISQEGILRSELYKPNLDNEKRLQVAVAVGINGDVAKRAQDVANLGADLIVIDTAHGHQRK